VETLKRVDFLNISEIVLAPQTTLNADERVKSSLSGWRDQESPLSRGTLATQLKLQVKKSQAQFNEDELDRKMIERRA